MCKLNSPFGPENTNFPRKKLWCITPHVLIVTVFLALRWIAFHMVYTQNKVDSIA